MAALLAWLAGRGGAGKRERHTTYLKQKRRTKGWITFELKVLLVDMFFDDGNRFGCSKRFCSGDGLSTFLINLRGSHIPFFFQSAGSKEQLKILKAAENGRVHQSWPKSP